MSSPYETLGVASDATTDQIKKAYRRLARKLHPDLNPGDKAAEEKFKDVANAYRLLIDPEKRALFDQGAIDETGAERPRREYYRDYAQADAGYGDGGFGGYADFAEAGDPFAEFFRRTSNARANRRGQDLRYHLEISLARAIEGGAERVVLGDGGTLDVNIPPGVTQGQTLRLRGKGAKGAGTGGDGDAFIELQIAPDPRFLAEGDSLTIEVPISLKEAVLGARITVPTPTGHAEVGVPAGSDGNTRLRLKGQGMPLRSGGRGDEFVRLKIVLQKPMDAELAQFVKNWESGASFNPREGGAA
ncbi:DnaJ domain-containing protein [Stenotrophomonas sp. PA-6-5C]|uniref:DnaJ C-terminal domain-containing protein n=1 Tax=Stenotrophomonas sp. PA-6-5C TaxID=2665487 RepID=UPI001F32E821|nr:DnaJ C-terminal domain-containing protein [Stenotrophomonas sp. PA-6-5C]MCF5092008.1 DnaJ domain-containing protein [Stenotrophomonas sp. PA-6-5C]